MPDRSGEDLEILRNRSAAGGINSFSHPFDIADNQAVELTNIDASQPGLRKSRQGVQLIATGMTFGPVLALGAFQPVNAEAELLAISPGATYPNAQHLKLWRWDGISPTWTLMGTFTGITCATLGIEMVPGIDLNSITSKPYIERFFFQQTQQLAYVYDGTSLGVTNAAAAAPVSGMFPAANIMNRCFAQGDGTNRAKLFFTDSGEYGYTGWSTALSVTLGGGARQLIKKIQPFRNTNLVVFFADKIENLSVADTSLTIGTSAFTGWSRQVIDTRIGCAGHKCVVSTGEDLVFADQLGNIRSLNQTITDNQQGVKSLPISSLIQATIDRINSAAIDKIAMEFYDRFVICGFPLDTATEVSHSYVYDVINRAWYGPWTGRFPAKSMTVATLTNPAAVAKYQNPSLYLGSQNTTGPGLVYHAFDGTTDCGEAILFQEITKRYHADQIEIDKFFRRFKDIYQATGSQEVKVEARKDGGDWKTLEGNVDLTGDTPSLPITFPFSFGGSGVVRKNYSLEFFGEHVQDMQFRLTATATSEIRHLGFSVGFHRKNFDWKVN